MLGTAIELYIDAYGRRRNADDWTYYNITAPTLLKRGYTGHEHLDSFNLINMNGRVYDPIIGRMLSPDIYTSANSTQGLNLYTYCNNNPIAFSEPSGYRAYGSGNGGGQNLLKKYCKVQNVNCKM